MTLMAAPRTSAHSAAFDIVSIVPSISMPWTTLPATMTTARDIWAMRQVGRSPNRRRSAAKTATAKIAHMAITPKGENGVGDANRRASIMSGGLVIQRPADVDHHRHHQRASDPAMCTPPTLGRQSRQVSARQQRLNEHETQREYPCESGQDVDRTAPCEQRARRCGGDRHAKWRLQGRPRSGSPWPISSLCSQLGRALPRFTHLRHTRASTRLGRRSDPESDDLLWIPGRAEEARRNDGEQQVVILGAASWPCSKDRPRAPGAILRDAAQARGSSG